MITFIFGRWIMGSGIATHRAQENSHLLWRARVLLVEPDARDRQYYSAILQRQGFEVYACTSYNDAERILATGPVDFAVINQGSRAFEGRTLLERVLTIDRHIPVVVLTRAVDMNCYLEAMQMGAVDYLEKPLSAEEVLRLIETHLRPRAAVV
jgi:two-component system phosphoglycerate transport system response regulator PgtA